MSDPKPSGRDRGPGVDWKTVGTVVVSVVTLVTVVFGLYLKPINVKLDGIEKALDIHIAADDQPSIKAKIARIEGRLMMFGEPLDRDRWSPPPAGP